MIIDQLSNATLLTKQKTEQGMVKVFENSLFRWLCFDDEQAIQSCMLRKKPAKLMLPYQPFMMMWPLLKTDQPPLKMALLGLGGGDLVRYLRKHIPFINVRAVDNDAVVVKFATEYFELCPDQNLTVEIADAEEFIQRSEQYDLLLIDVVKDNALPEFIHKKAFWEHCHHSLNNEAVIVLNVIPESEKSFLALLKLLREEFGHLPLCMGVPDHKNVVLLMPVSEKAIPDLKELKRRGDELQMRSGLPFKECVEILVRDNVVRF